LIQEGTGREKALATELKELSIGVEAMEAEVRDLETDLYEIDQRNSEIEDQLEGK